MALRTAARLTAGVCGLALAVTPIAITGGAQPRATPGRDSGPCARQIPRGAAFFARMVEGRTDGWLAGDLPASVDLRDGRVLWLFNDTWVGRRLPDGSFAPGTTLWHNSALVQTGACVDFVGAGGNGWLTIPATPDWWWPTAGVVRRTGRGAVVDVFVDRMHRTGPGTFDFTPVGADVVELRARDLAVRRVRPLPHQDRVWGASVVGDGRWLYLFGRGYRAGPSTYLARVAANDPFGRWTFWTGRRWSTDPSHAGAVLTYRPFNNPQMTRLGPGRWLAVAKDRELDGTAVIGWTARRPQGPWRATGPLVGAPTSGRPGEFTYLAVAHPEIRVGAGRLLVSWNVDTTGLPLAAIAFAPYGPRFAVIRMPRHARGK